MSSSQELRRAIDTARAGRNREARDLFLKLVEADPQSEAAWIWLSGLVDSMEDKIIACENVLTLNPGNERVRSYLMQLQKKQDEAFRQDQRREAQELFQQAKACAERGDVVRALSLAHESTQRHPDNEAVWLFIADISSSTEEQVAALEKAVAINPSNSNTLRLLQQARQLRDNPLGVAAHYEQMGKFDEALSLYDQLASRTKNPREFDRIYQNILRIESLKKEKIQYVAPRASIYRLAFAWPLLYFFLVLVQVGLNPFRYPALHLWMGLPVVAVGSFLLSLSEVRSQHLLWKELFSEEGDGSRFARRVTAAAGWLFVIFPHVLLLIDSLNRLNLLQIPPEPF
jgi:tetratricopeptide (TPR) repeat protein